MQTQKASAGESKVPPSEIPADSFRISSTLAHEGFVIDSQSSPLMKIYYQKKQFVWEFTKSGDGQEKPKKWKVEVKFGDIVSIAVCAKDGMQGKLEISKT